MSHLKLDVLISTDGADFAEQAESSPFELMASQLEGVAEQLRGRRSGGDIRDANGNRYGRWDLLQVVD